MKILLYTSSIILFCITSYLYFFTNYDLLALKLSFATVFLAAITATLYENKKKDKD